LNLPARGFVAAIDSRTDKVVWKKEMPLSNLGRSGSITTAGGLLFRGTADGDFEAFDARTGDLLWDFQIGREATPASTYEIDGEQYVAMSAGPSVWAFKLGGAIPPAAKQAASGRGNVGAISETERIETSSLVRDNGVNGQRYASDEYAFNPIRARIKEGSEVSWINNGRLIHTIVAQDGSWTTGSIKPGQQASVRFDKAGTYLYNCKEHPWSIGQLIVEGNSEKTGARENSSSDSNAGRVDRDLYTQQQAARGHEAYLQSCSGCHGSDLAGNGQAPPLAGDVFLQRWSSRAVGELFGKLSTTMPQTSPGSLGSETYLDITAFLLQANAIPSGKEDLKSDSRVMQSVLNSLIH